MDILFLFIFSCLVVGFNIYVCFLVKDIKRKVSDINERTSYISKYLGEMNLQLRQIMICHQDLKITLEKILEKSTTMESGLKESVASKAATSKPNNWESMKKAFTVPPKGDPNG